VAGREIPYGRDNLLLIASQESIKENISPILTNNQSPSKLSALDLALNEIPTGTGPKFPPQFVAFSSAANRLAVMLYDGKFIAAGPIKHVVKFINFRTLGY
jgi:hypothetical protein